MPDAVRAPSDRSPGGAGALDHLLDVAVASLAWWTVVYHLATALDVARDVAGAAWVAGSLVAVALLLVPHRSAPLRLRPVAPGATVQGRRLVGAAVVLTVGAAAISATRWSHERPEFWLVWVMVLAGLAAALVALARRRRVASAVATTDAGGTTAAGSAATGGVLLVVFLGLLAAVGSAVTVRPDADDVFLVNRSTYVEEHSGPLPERDTIYSDEVFAASRPEVPGTSIESLLGMVAAWSPLRAPTVTYLVFGPLVAFLMAPALWRMLRTLGAAAPAAATAAAFAFLLVDGGTHYTFGNFSFARAWQGKVAFLVVVVPALWHHGLRWGRDRSRRDLVLLAVAGVAGIGLTTTAAFVGPTVAAIAVVAGVVATAGWPRLGPGLLAAAPAGLAAVAFTVLPRQDPAPALGTVAAGIGGDVLAVLGQIHVTFTDGINPGRQWHWMYHGGIGMLVAAGAALVAWTLVRDAAARLALVLAPLVLFGFFYGPGTFDTIADVSGVRSILWRSAWLLPVPAAVGLLVTAPLLVRRATREARWAATALSGAVVVVAMLVWSSPVLDPDNRGITIGRPAWDLDPGANAAAARLVELSEPGDVVAAPEVVGGALAIRTTAVRPVNARNQYLSGRHAVPEFRGLQRELVSRAMTVGIEPVEVTALREALHALSVDAACVAAGLQSPWVTEALRTAGLRSLEADDVCHYWRAAS